jgi:hypothetical protein
MKKIVIIDQDLSNLLEALDTYRSDEHYKTACVRLAEVLKIKVREAAFIDDVEPSTVKGTSSNFGPGKWSKRKTKYDASCSYPGCGEFISAGTICWVTVGESPRCEKHGHPSTWPRQELQESDAGLGL